MGVSGGGGIVTELLIYLPCSWLFECAVAQRLVPVEPHLLANKDAGSNAAEQAGEGGVVGEGGVAGEGGTVAGEELDDGARGVAGELEEGVAGAMGEGGVEEKELPLSGVVICFNKNLSSLSC